MTPSSVTNSETISRPMGTTLQETRACDLRVERVRRDLCEDRVVSRPYPMAG